MFSCRACAVLQPLHMTEHPCPPGGAEGLLLHCTVWLAHAGCWSLLSPQPGVAEQGRGGCTGDALGLFGDTELHVPAGFS